ncbi:MAG: enoyl-CoA hydratase/isomerase family protein [Candidatus Hydrogenedentota bacterium]|jgi:enoyl-CoA hydratase/carnithine racemase
MKDRYGDVSVGLMKHVALVEIHRPPHNFFDHDLICDIADAFEALDEEMDCRSIMLASEGKSFCAGANFQNRNAETDDNPAKIAANPLYAEAVRVFACKKPVVAAVQGAAIGGGFGLAMAADFRVACPEARFAANFVRLGIHPGFGLTHTLPRLIGVQKASLMFYTGRRINGETALEMGVADVLTSKESLRDEAFALASEIAEGAPLALMSTRATMRQGLADAVKAQTDHEFAEQERLFSTEDHREGVLSVTERRPGIFFGK